VDRAREFDLLRRQVAFWFLGLLLAVYNIAVVRRPLLVRLFGL
jgi:hypothetical protein